MGAVGPPEKYSPEFCQKLIEHMAKGFSFESFAAIAGVHTSTLYEWTKASSQYFIPELSEAKKTAFNFNRLFWEAAGIRGLFVPEGVKFSSSTYIFNMKNRFPKEWRDKQEVEHAGKVEHQGKINHQHQHTVDLSGLSLEDLEQLEKLTAKMEGKAVENL